MSGALPLDRRSLLAAAMLAGSGTAIASDTTASDFARLPLWPDVPPSGEHVAVIEQSVQRSAAADDIAITHVRTPVLFRLTPKRPNGAALLLIPGGSYRRVAMKPEGYVVARHFGNAGFTCYILVYRLPGDGWTAGPDAPLQDAQRAMRLIRAEAASRRFDPQRIGAIGFSAGGHLAARLASEPEPAYQPVDAADKLGSEPALSALIYPVVTMDGPFTHTGSRDELLGTNSSSALRARYSTDRLVGKVTPPTFLALAADDPSVPPENSMMMYAALRRNHIPSELHVFERGGHGFGMILPDGSQSPWPELFLSWARRHGFAS